MHYRLAANVIVRPVHGHQYVHHECLQEAW